MAWERRGGSFDSADLRDGEQDVGCTSRTTVVGAIGGYGVTVYLAHDGAGANGMLAVYLAHGGAGAYGMLLRATIYNCLSRGGGRRRRTPSEKNEPERKAELSSAAGIN